MSARKYPPTPKAPPAVDKFTVWTVYRGDWFSVRSFGIVDEAREFAREVFRGPVLITTERVTRTINAAEFI